jgi:hypothetical protein
LLYNSTKTLLQTIVQSLESGDSNEWDDQIESLKSCLYEMHQMSRPTRAYQPVCDRLNQAVPHVKSMLSAIRRKDHVAALNSGKAALAVM